MSGWDVSSTPTWGPQDGSEDTQAYKTRDDGSLDYGHESMNSPATGLPEAGGGFPGDGPAGGPPPEFFGQDYGQDQDPGPGGFPQRTPGRSLQDLPRGDTRGRHGSPAASAYGRNNGYGQDNTGTARTTTGTARTLRVRPRTAGLRPGHPLRPGDLLRPGGRPRAGGRSTARRRPSARTVPSARTGAAAVPTRPTLGGPAAAMTTTAAGAGPQGGRPHHGTSTRSRTRATAMRTASTARTLVVRATAASPRAPATPPRTMGAMTFPVSRARAAARRGHRSSVAEAVTAPR